MKCRAVQFCSTYVHDPQATNPGLLHRGFVCIENTSRGERRGPRWKRTGMTILQASQHSAGDGVVRDELLGSCTPLRLARAALQLPTRLEHDCGTDGAGGAGPPPPPPPPPLLLLFTLLWPPEE